MSKIKYGLSNCYVALRKEVDGNVSYETPFRIPGAVSLSIDRETNNVKFFADNIAYWIGNAKTGLTGELTLADIAREVQKKVLGYVEATEGGLLETNSVTTPQFALIFQVETDEKNRKFVLYNCVAAETGEEYATVEDNITPTTSKLNLTCAGESVGDHQVFKHVIEDGDANYSTITTEVTVPTEKGN